MHGLWHAPRLIDRRTRGRARSIPWLLIGLSIVLAVGLEAPVLANRLGSHRTPARGTIAAPFLPGQRPLYIFPMNPAADVTFGNNQEFQYLMYKPLYWFGNNGHATMNPRLSLAEPPVFSNSNRSVTIVLKPYVWSDGVPLTTRDVRFWMDILQANKTSWGNYVPTEFPDNISHITWTSASRFTITFARSWNPIWILYNQLSQIIPIPQHSWDRTSSSSPVGNYDETPAGARAVFKYLNAQALTLTTYATNPLWQVVDGPWHIERADGFSPATGTTTFAANARYSGPDRPHVAKFEEIPFTSDTAEFDALRSGELQVGGVPITDLSQLRSFRAQRYSIQLSYLDGWTFIGLNYTNPAVSPLFKQLYIRQALQTTIDQSQWVRAILKGYGKPEYSPIPTVVPDPFLDSFVQHNPYPFSVRTAEALLRRHGWKVVPNGTSTCAHPGLGSSTCGPGIKRGAPLALDLTYGAGDLPLTQEMEAFKSSASQAGITINLREEVEGSLFAQYSQCQAGKLCPWEMIDLGIAGDYVYYPDYYPSGEPYYLPHSPFNSGGYANATATRLILATLQQTSRRAFQAYENFIATNLPTLWTPNAVFSITVYSPKIAGVPPADPFANIYPQDLRLKA